MSLVDAPPRTFPTRGGAALAPAPARRPAERPSDRARHLRVVRPTDRRRRRLTPATGMVLTGLLFATLFAIAISHTVLVQGQIRLDELDAQLTTEQARYRELRKDVAEMESPSRIVAAAQELGMVAPDDLVYLQPSTDDGTGTRSEGGVGDDGAGGASDQGVASRVTSDWSTVKPLLEAAAP